MNRGVKTIFLLYPDALDIRVSFLVHNDGYFPSEFKAVYTFNMKEVYTLHMVKAQEEKHFEGYLGLEDIFTEEELDELKKKKFNGFDPDVRIEALGIPQAYKKQKAREAVVYLFFFGLFCVICYWAYRTFTRKTSAPKIFISKKKKRNPHKQSLLTIKDEKVTFCV